MKIKAEENQVMVGVLSYSDELLSAMEKSWRQDDIQVYKIDPKKLLEKKESLSDLYKIFIYFQPTELTDDNINSLSKALFNVSEKCYFLVHLPYSNREDGQRLFTFITKIQQRLPYANLILYQDVIANTLYSSLSSSTIHFTFSEIWAYSLQELVDHLKHFSVRNKGGKRVLLKGEKNFFPFLKEKLTLLPIYQSSVSQLGEKYSTQQIRSQVTSHLLSKMIKVEDKGIKIEESTLPKPSLKRKSIPTEKKIESMPPSDEVKSIKKMSKKGRAVVIPKLAIPEIRRSKIILENISKISEEKREKKIAAQQPSVAETVKKRQIEKENNRAVLTSKHPVDVKIAQIFSRSLPQQQLRLPARQKKKAKKTVFFSKHKVLGLAVIATAGIVSAGIGGFWLSAHVTDTLYQKTFQLSGQEVLPSWKSKIKSLYEFQLSIYKPVLGKEFVEKEKKKTAVIDKVLAVSDLKKNFRDQFIELITGVFAGQQSDQLKNMENVSGQADELYKMIGGLEPSLQQNNDTQDPSQLLKTLKSIKKGALQFQQFYPVLFDLLGKNGARNIAVLIQDNQEIRPAGGYIEGVLLLKTDQGKIIDWKVVSAESIDEDLSGAIAPPADLQTYLKENQWFFRDSNWKVDFPQTAQQVKHILQLALSENTDYVIALNQESLQALLTPRNVLEVEGERLTYDNFYERLFQYARKSVEKGNQQSLSLSVVRQLLEKLEKKELVVDNQVLSQLYQGLEKGEVLFYAEQPQFQSTLESMGWAGNLYTPPCPTVLFQETCIVHSVAQFDTNVGINKVNNYIEKQTTHTIQIEKDKTIHNYILSYANGSKGNSWPGGTYKNYLRIAIPRETVLENVFINNQIASNDMVIKNVEGDRRIIGVYVEIAPESQTQVEIRYSEKGISEPFTYVVFHQHQPGITKERLTVNLQAPNAAVPLIIAPEASITGNTITYQAEQPGHYLAGVKYQ